MPIHQYVETKFKPWDTYPIASTFYSGPGRIVAGLAEVASGVVLTILAITCGWVDGRQEWRKQIAQHAWQIALGLGDIGRGFVVFVPILGNVAIYFWDNAFETTLPSTDPKEIEAIFKVKKPKESKYDEKESIDWGTRLRGELDQLKNIKNPQPTSEITHVIVFSAVADCNGNLPSDLTLEERARAEKNKQDDRQRLYRGITLAKEVAALKARKKKEELTSELIKNHGPIIVYNGRDDQNAALRTVLNSAEGIGDNILDYPKEKFQVIDLKDAPLNTKGQFLSFQTHLNSLSNTTIALVSHMFHFPRIGRMIEKYPFGTDLKFYGYKIDRQRRLPNARENEQVEITNIPRYISQGDLLSDPSPRITYASPRSTA